MTRLFWLALLAAPLHAVADEDWKKALEAPLSSGAVAALVDHGETLEVQARWREALKDTASETRAAAARVVYASGRPELRADLSAALQAETEEPAAAEQIRALVYVGQSEDDAVVLDAARRFPRLRPLAANLLGRRRGIEALRHLAAFAAIDDDGVARRCLVQAATRGGRESLDRAAEVVLQAGDAVAWAAIWGLAVEGAAIKDDNIASSMTSPNALIRAATYWHVAMFIRRPVSLSKGLNEAFKAAPEARAEAEVAADEAAADAAFAFELTRRAREEKPRKNLAYVRGLAQRSAPLPGLLADVAGLLTKEERAVLVEHKLLPEAPEPPPMRAARFARPPKTDFRAEDFPASYVDGLLKLAGCEHDGSFDAQVTYEADGRPGDVSVIEGPPALSPACVDAARRLFRATFHSAYTDPRHSSRLAAEPSRHRVRIVRGAALAGGVVGGVVGGLPVPPPDGPVRVGGNIKEPKKLKEVRPVYPALARSERIQGIVIMEAIIDREGKVSDVRLMRGVDGLSQAAMDAVRQWEYTPTLLNGVAVPVIMTVTVNFTLH